MMVNIYCEELGGSYLDDSVPVTVLYVLSGPSVCDFCLSAEVVLGDGLTMGSFGLEESVMAWMVYDALFFKMDFFG